MRYVIYEIFQTQEPRQEQKISQDFRIRSIFFRSSIATTHYGSLSTTHFLGAKK